MILFRVMMFLVDLIQKIKDFFLSLLFPNGDDFKNQKALRSIMTEVKKAKYPIYRSDSTILAGLPIIIYELFVALMPLKKLLLATIASNDIRISSSFLDKMVEAAFSEDEKKLKEKFKIENRKEDINDYLRADFDQKIKDQTKMFNDFLVVLNNNKFKKVDEVVNKCFAFFDFTNFKFNAFFAHFDSDFNEISNGDTIKEHYNFESVAGMEVLQEILDLNFLLKNIIIDKEFVSGLFFLNSQLPEDIMKDENLIKRDLHNFSFIIENNLGKNSLKNLAKLIKQDPFFEDSTIAPTQFRVVVDYRQRLQDLFNSDTKKILNIQQDAKLAESIEKLFNGMEMISLKTYNTALDQRIQAVTTYSLDWVKPLELIFTFTKRFFEPNFKAFLRELIVEGFFEDKKFQSILATDYYFCESIPDKIKIFENLTDENSEQALSKINNLLGRLENGEDFKKPLIKIIDHLNTKAKSLVEEIALKYGSLYKSCELIVDDSHLSIPNFVSNLKAMIISTKNKNNFASLEENMQKFKDFLDIIKKYAIIETVELKKNIPID